MNHTPTPWIVEYSPDARFGAPMADANSTARAKLTTIRAGYVNARERPLVLADACIPNSDDTAFIVQACNAHEALVAALEDAVKRLERVDTELLRMTGQPFEHEIGEVLRGRAALKLATGE